MTHRVSKETIQELTTMLSQDTSDQLTGETESPWWSVTAFIEELLPAFAETMQGGNTTERYHELLAMVLSDMEESELEKVLLMAAGSNMDRDVEKNAT